MNTQRVVDLGKVSYADFFWRTVDGMYRSRTKPTAMTVHGQPRNPDELALPLDGFPGETVGQRAIRKGLVDQWRPVVVLRVSSAEKLEFVGDRAVSLWDAFKAKQFKTLKTT